MPQIGSGGIEQFRPHVRVWRFTWTTALGYLPLTALVAYLGSQAKSLLASNPGVWIAALLVLGLLGVARFARIERLGR